jgi:hypothetical protein
LCKIDQRKVPGDRNIIAVLFSSVKQFQAWTVGR